MGYVDVAIPGVIGLLLLFFPQQFAKKTGDHDKDRTQTLKFRKIGVLLIGVAMLYLACKLLRDLH